MSDKIKKSYRQSRNIYDDVLTRSTWWGRLYMDLFWGGVDDNEIARKVLDYSRDMLDRARARFRQEDIGNCRLIQGDVGALPFDDDTFDIVLTMNGFHAFPDKEKAYSEVNRVLRPGGCLIGCFCIRGESRRTDWLMRRILSPRGWFTPPFETYDSLMARLSPAYHLDEYHKEGSIVYFAVTKKA